MTVLLEVILPVLLIFSSGYAVQKWQKMNLRSISTVAIYILTPCLVFRTFYQTDLNRDYMYMVLFSLGLLLALIGLNKLWAWLRGYSSSVESGLILSTAFMNSGNYGVPIILFAYGETGFNYAVTFMVLQSIIMNFFGVYYAAKGQAGISTALKVILQMPATYAAIIALMMQIFHWPLPENFYLAIDLVAEAAIPIVMLILGMQLAELRVSRLAWEKISLGVTLRLFISPLLAFLLVMAMPLDPLLQKVLIVSSAMPSAATTTMYALQFDAEPQLVASITLVTTLLSVITLSVLLMLLG